MNKQHQPQIIGIIPARGGSKSVPYKNIKPLAGIPLLVYMLKAALGSKFLTRVLVSSEDKKILAVARKYGGPKTVLARPKRLALDSTPSLPVIKHAVKKIESREGSFFDYIVMLQPTTPLVTSRDIDAALHKLIRTKADTVVSVYQVNDSHPVKMKKIVKDRLVPYFPGIKEVVFRRQDLDPVYKRNGGIYASKREVVMRQGLLYGGRITRPYVMPSERSVDVNSHVDFLVLEAIVRQNSTKKRLVQK